MAAPRNNQSKTNQSCRDKIQTTQLLKRLEDHAFGVIELSQTQVAAIKLLIGKTLPDLSAVAHTDADGENLPPTTYIMNINGVSKK